MAGCSSWPNNVGGVNASDDDCELYVGSVIDDGMGVGGVVIGVIGVSECGVAVGVMGAGVNGFALGES